jgi:hypothetical protein
MLGANTDPYRRSKSAWGSRARSEVLLETRHP